MESDISESEDVSEEITNERVEAEFMHTRAEGAGVQNQLFYCVRALWTPSK